MALHTPSISSIYNKGEMTSPLMQSVLLIVVIALFSWFIVKPALSQSQAVREELRVATEKRAAVENDKRELNRLVSQLQSSESDIKITDEALPLVGRISKLDVLVDTLAKSSGLQVINLSVAETGNSIAAGNKEVLADPYAAQRELQTQSMSILVSGTIDQFRNFLQLLETSGRLLDVSNLKVTSDTGAIKYNLTIKGYAYDVSTGVKGANAGLNP